MLVHDHPIGARKKVQPRPREPIGREAFVDGNVRTGADAGDGADYVVGLEVADGERLVYKCKQYLINIEIEIERHILTTSSTNPPQSHPTTVRSPD
jgi:hypothetical protein